MGAFNTKSILNGNPSLIPQIADAISAAFAAEGYDTKHDSLISGGAEVFISKGGIFKELMGMRTALKVTLIPSGNQISFEAGIGVFGQQFLPTIISMFFAWPVLVTQIWGLVKQSKLDDTALEIANKVISGNCHSYDNSSTANSKFCTSCGASVSSTSKFCPNCGTKL